MVDKTILIVEDERDLRDVLIIGFKKAGYKVLSAINGEEALSICMTDRPDFILLDILMPKMDGLELLSKIRKEKEWGEKVPVMMLTNFSDKEKISQATAAGAYDYVVKTDWTVPEIVEKVIEKISLI